MSQLALGETKLICWSTGPTDPILSKNKKNNIKFRPTGYYHFFFNLFFFFSEKKKEQEIKHNKLI